MCSVMGNVVNHSGTISPHSTPLHTFFRLGAELNSITYIFVRTYNRAPHLHIHHHHQMSDLLYPRNVSQDKYNREVLEFIPMLTYTVEHTPGETMAVVYETETASNEERTLKTRIPATYYEHLQRFLWQYYMWYGVYRSLHLKSKLLSTTSISLFQHMLVLMDAVVEQLLLGCIALGKDLSEDSRIDYFDYYLTTEFVVGRHQPPIVEEWRRKVENRDLDLERIDPFRLGM